MRLIPASPGGRSLRRRGCRPAATGLVVAVTTAAALLAAANAKLVVVKVSGPGGEVAAAGSAQVDGPNVTYRLTEVPPAGDYRIVYRVVSADGHPVNGESTFGVQAPPLAAPQQMLQGRGLAPEPPTTAAPDPATGHHGAPSAPGTGVFPDPSAPAAAGHGQHTVAAAPAGSSAPAPAAAPPSVAVPASPGDDQAGSDPGSGPDPADGVGAPGPVAH